MDGVAGRLITYKINFVGDVLILRSGSMNMLNDAEAGSAAVSGSGSKRIEFEYDPGLSMEIQLLHGSGKSGSLLDNADGVFRAAPAVDKAPVPEHLVANGFFRDIPGTYVYLDSRAPFAPWPDGQIVWKANIVGASLVVRSGSLNIENPAPVPVSVVDQAGSALMATGGIAPSGRGYAIGLVDGLPVMSWDQDATIATDLLLSALVPQGAFFLDPSFGLRDLPKKITDGNAGLVKDYFQESSQWLVDAGKAKSIEVIAEPDLQEKSRINVKQTAIQANDEPAEFSTFVPVV
jgi:hypothetical protein